AGYVLVRIGLPPKRAIPFRSEEPFDKIAVNLIAPNGSEGQKIEFLCNGQQVVVAGIHPDTKRLYRWHGGKPGEIKREDLPYTREAEARALVDDLVELLLHDFGYTREAEVGNKKTTGNGGDAGAASDWASADDLIDHDKLTTQVAKLIRSSMNAGAIVNMLRAQLSALVGVDPERKQRRLEELPGIVKSAERKIGGPTEPPLGEPEQPPPL